MLNAILDYIMMAKLGMGIKGSAIATLIVQIVTVVFQFVYFFGQGRNIRFCRFSYNKDVNREILLNGSSEFIEEMASAISMFAFNFVLMKYVGTEGVAAFTVFGFVVYGYSMIATGFGQGLTAPVSVLWGAKEKETAIELRKITNRILFCIGFVFAVCFLAFGRKYAGFFGCSNEVVDMISIGFRFFTVTFLIRVTGKKPERHIWTTRKLLLRFRCMNKERSSYEIRNSNRSYYCHCSGRICKYKEKID